MTCVFMWSSMRNCAWITWMELILLYFWNLNELINWKFIVYLCVVFFIIATAIKCWICSSDTSTGAFCSDHFDTSAIPDESRRWAYAECASPTLSSLSFGGKPGCQKIKDRGKFIDRKIHSSLKSSSFLQFTISFRWQIHLIFKMVHLFENRTWFNQIELIGWMLLVSIFLNRTVNVKCVF